MEKPRLTLPGPEAGIPGGGHNPGGGLGPGPWPGGPCAVMNFSKSSAVELSSLCPRGAQAGPPPLSKLCVLSCAQPGEEDTPREGEEIQISLVPGLLRRSSR